MANKNYILPCSKEIHYFPYVLVGPRVGGVDPATPTAAAAAAAAATDRIYYLNTRYMLFIHNLP